MEEKRKQLIKNIFKGIVLIAVAAVVLAAAARLFIPQPFLSQPKFGDVDGIMESPMAAPSGIGGFSDMAGLSLFKESAPARSRSLQVPTGQDQLSERKVIQAADLRLAVKSVKRAVEAIQKIASDNNGYIQHSSVDKINEDKSSGFVQIRVPADRLTVAIEVIENSDFIIEMTSKNISSRDVTLEFIDYEARLKILRKTEEELLALLKKSGSLADILSVQRELNNTRTQIEQIQAQLNYLSSQINYALISVSLSEEIPEFLGIRWKPLVKVKEEIQNLLKSLRDYGNFLIKFVVYYIPLLIVWAVLIWLILWIFNGVYNWLKIKFNWQHQIQLNNLNFWLKLLGLIAIILIILSLF